MDLRGALAFATPWAAAGLASWAFFGIGRSPGWPSWIERPSLLGFSLFMPGNLVAGLLYLGLFALPFAVGALVALGGASPFGETGPEPLPMLDNILYDFGTGPLTLRDLFLASG